MGQITCIPRIQLFSIMRLCAVVGVFNAFQTSGIVPQPKCFGQSNSIVYESCEIFPLQYEHVHGSTVVELPNGDLLSAWFQGSGERWANDVRIMGARRRADAPAWSNPFVMADVPGFPDINPILFLDPNERLWLAWYTVITIGTARMAPTRPSST